MKKTIEEIFEDQDFDIRELSKNHESRFLQKLRMACEDLDGDVVTNDSPSVKSHHTFSKWYRWGVAAMFALLIAVSGFLAGRSQADRLETVSPKMATVQKQYVTAVDQQLTLLEDLQSPATEHIISDAKAKLLQLENDYENILLDFKSNTENDAVIDAMIQNFKTRILILESARGQIKTTRHQLKRNNHEFL